VLHAAITAGMMNFVYCTPEPILSLRLLDYDLSDRNSGLIFGIVPLTYMIGTFSIPYLVPKWVEHRVTLITCLFILSVATILVGPFFEDLNLISMCTGLAISGFMLGFLCIPNMPEMMQACRESHPRADLDVANSLLSGMLNAGFGLGQALGPLSGAFNTNSFASGQP
jgi:MFS family permease